MGTLMYLTLYAACINMVAMILTLHFNCQHCTFGILLHLLSQFAVNSSFIKGNNLAPYQGWIWGGGGGGVKEGS